MENEEIEFVGVSVTIQSAKGGYIVIIDGEPQVTTSLQKAIGFAREALSKQ